MKPTLYPLLICLYMMACTTDNQPGDPNKTVTKVASDSIPISDEENEEEAAPEYQLTVSPAYSPYEEGKNLSNDLKAFIPENFEILDTTSADINSDGNPDIVMVLHVKNEEDLREGGKTEEDLPRPILLLAGNPDGTFKLAARNNHDPYCITCGGMMGDPYQGVAASKGSFTFVAYGGSSWRWAVEDEFAWVPAENTWKLSRKRSISYQVFDTTSFKDKTKIAPELKSIKFEDFTAED